MEPEGELDATTFQIYLCLVRSGEPLGPRDVMRNLNLSSPGVAHRGLQKLVERGLADKDAYGRYEARERIGVRGYVWLGSNLVSHFVLFSCFFLGLFAAELVVLAVRLSVGEVIESSFVLLIGVTAFSAAVFLLEGVYLREKRKVKSA